MKFDIFFNTAMRSKVLNECLAQVYYEPQAERGPWAGIYCQGHAELTKLSAGRGIYYAKYCGRGWLWLNSKKFCARWGKINLKGWRGAWKKNIIKLRIIYPWCQIHHWKQLQPLTNMNLEVNKFFKLCDALRRADMPHENLKRLVMDPKISSSFYIEENQGKAMRLYHFHRNQLLRPLIQEIRRLRPLLWFKSNSCSQEFLMAAVRLKRVAAYKDAQLFRELERNFDLSFIKVM